jgi:TolB protein
MQRLRLAGAGLVLAIAFVAGIVFAGPAGATFPGDNGQIALASNGDPFGTNPEHDFEIFRMNRDGSGLTQLTFNAATDFAPDWSPDGRKITFRSRRDAGNREIYVMNADGSQQTRLTVNPATDDAPSWSADGTKIYFHSTRTGNLEVFVMKADESEAVGGAVVNLSNNPAADGRPVESPDGRTIAFVSERDGPSAIYTMRVDGSDVRRLTPGTVAWAANPNWSPDGRMIAFVNNFCGPCPASDIFVMKRNGTAIRQLTASFGNNLYPFWSPEGDKIAFTHWVDLDAVNADIYLMDTAGDGRTNITNSPTVDDEYPAWGRAPANN